jgi:hypothetical protein
MSALNGILRKSVSNLNGFTTNSNDTGLVNSFCLMTPSPLQGDFFNHPVSQHKKQTPSMRLLSLHLPNAAADSSTSSNHNQINNSDHPTNNNNNATNATTHDGLANVSISFATEFKLPREPLQQIIQFHSILFQCLFKKYEATASDDDSVTTNLEDVLAHIQKMYLVLPLDKNKYVSFLLHQCVATPTTTTTLIGLG